MIFECREFRLCWLFSYGAKGLIDNIIREALKQRLVSMSGRGTSHHLMEDSVSRSPRFNQISQLHAFADAKCHEGARLVVSIIRRDLSQNFVHNQMGGVLFQFDASLVRDGIFFAAFLLAGEPGKIG